MPRRRRLFIPGLPQHITARGHNRNPVFITLDDFRFFYRSLKTSALEYSLSVHAWVFMHNHIHLLATPSTPASLAKTMQSVGRKYVQYFNRTYQCSGALWEGRYKSSLIDAEKYLLSCYRYIELNPVRAGIVVSPEEYAYSSYHANALGKPDLLIHEHPQFSSFINRAVSDGSGNTGRAAYQALCQGQMDNDTLFRIRHGTDKGSGIGRHEFLRKLAKLRQGG